MNLIGEVHAHRQLDEQVDAETIATLRDGGLTWRHTSIKRKEEGVWVCVSVTTSASLLPASDNKYFYTIFSAKV